MDKHTKEYEKVIQYLKVQIAKDELKVGEKLPSERELSEQLGISRNSIREALRMMEHMGFVRCRQGSGNYMVLNAEKSFSEIFDMMLLLKQVSSREICSFRRNLDKALCFSLIEEGEAADLSGVEHALKREREAATAEEQIESDRAFHFSLIEATRNQMWICISNAVINVYRNCIDESRKHADERMKGKLQEIHEGILAAIKERDKAECESLIDQHYDIAEGYYYH